MSIIFVSHFKPSSDLTQNRLIEVRFDDMAATSEESDLRYFHFPVESYEDGEVEFALVSVANVSVHV